jgi:hypothetical protein
MPGGELLGTSYRRWGEYLAAILIGNSIYFWAIEPRLPAKLHHQLFRVDLGLVVDFLICAGIYGIACGAGGFEGGLGKMGGEQIEVLECCIDWAVLTGRPEVRL